MLKYGGIKNHTIDYFVWCFGGGLFELVIPAQGFVASVVSLDSSWWKELGTMKSVQLGKLHCPRIYLQEFRNPPSKIKRIANFSSLTKPTQCVFQKNIVQLKPWKHWNLPFVFLIRWIKAPPPKRCRRRGAITKAKWWQMFGLCLRPSVCMEIWSGFWLEDDFSSSRCGFDAKTEISRYLTFTCILFRFFNEIRETTRSRSCVRWFISMNLEGIKSGQTKI